MTQGEKERDELKTRSLHHISEDTKHIQASLDNINKSLNNLTEILEKIANKLDPKEESKPSYTIGGEYTTR